MRFAGRRGALAPWGWDRLLQHSSPGSRDLGSQSSTPDPPRPSTTWPGVPQACSGGTTALADCRGLADPGRTTSAVPWELARSRTGVDSSSLGSARCQVPKGRRRRPSPSNLATPPPLPAPLCSRRGGETLRGRVQPPHTRGSGLTPGRAQVAAAVPEVRGRWLRVAARALRGRGCPGAESPLGPECLCRKTC